MIILVVQDPQPRNERILNDNDPRQFLADRDRQIPATAEAVDPIVFIILFVLLHGYRETNRVIIRVKEKCHQICCTAAAHSSSLYLST